MKYRALAVFVLMASLTVAAQQATPPAGHQHQHGAAASAPGGGHAEMAAHIEKMQAMVAQMKANLAKVKDAAVRQQLQLDADLWAAMVDHMQQMHGRMPAGGGMAMGHGEGKGGGCCAGMMKKEGSAAGGEGMAAGMGGAGGMSCGKGGCCGGGEGGGCCGGHGAKSTQP
jgi:hypothetical protein